MKLTLNKPYHQLDNYEEITTQQLVITGKWASDKVSADEPDLWLGKIGTWQAAILRHHEMGTLNGYACIPNDHPLYGKSAFEEGSGLEEIDVHGGLTYSGEALYIQSGHFFLPGWWVGFDTGHAWDWAPYYAKFNFHHPSDSTYKDFLYVFNEIIGLIHQLKGKR